MKTKLLGLILSLCAGLASADPVGGFFRLNQLAEGVSAPVVTNVTTQVVTLFNTNTSRSASRVLGRYVQNVGTVPILYTINSTTVSSTSFHGIMAGGQVALDGYGSVLDLSQVPFPVSFVTVSGTGKVAIVELTQ